MGLSEIKTINKKNKKEKSPPKEAETTNINLPKKETPPKEPFDFFKFYKRSSPTYSEIQGEASSTSNFIQNYMNSQVNLGVNSPNSELFLSHKKYREDIPLNSPNIFNEAYRLYSPSKRTFSPLIPSNYYQEKTNSRGISKVEENYLFQYPNVKNNFKNDYTLYNDNINMDYNIREDYIINKSELICNNTHETNSENQKIFTIPTNFNFNNYISMAKSSPPDALRYYNNNLISSEINNKDKIINESEKTLDGWLEDS